MIPDIFRMVYDAVYLPLEAAGAGLTAAFVNYVRSFIIAACVVGLAFRVIECMFTPTSTVAELYKFFGRMIFVMIACYTVPGYEKWVKNPLVGLSDGLSRTVARAFGNGSAGGGAAPFDAIFQDALLMGGRVWQSLGWTDFGPTFVVVVFWGVTALVVGYTFIVWLGGKIGLLIFLSVGPFMLCLLIFNSTRQKAYRWLDAVAYRIALLALCVIFVQFVLTAEALLLTQVGSAQSTALAKVMAVLSGTAIFALMGWQAKDLPQWARELSGGFGTHNANQAHAMTYGFAGGAAAGLVGAAASRFGKK